MYGTIAYAASLRVTLNGKPPRRMCHAELLCAVGSLYSGASILALDC